MRCFNPRTHEGCDITPLPWHCPRKRFNPRTHEGCDGGTDITSARPLSFNPRTHEGCDNTSLCFFGQCQSFNPRTHEGCDTSDDYDFEELRVSIHAPTRGATLSTVGDCIRARFQSTHPRGVRRISTLFKKLSSGSFNPRTHEGCDNARVYLLFIFNVSIHAPTRGATRTCSDT